MISNATIQQSTNFVMYRAPLGMGQIFSQGAVSGALAYFLLVLFQTITSPSYFDFLLAPFMPIVLAIGALFGLFAAVVISTVVSIAGRPIGRLARLSLIAGITVFIVYLFTNASPDFAMVPAQSRAMVLISVVVVGLTTGSHYHPGRALIRGLRSSHGQSHWAATALSAAFRMLSLFCAMELLLVTIITIRDEAATRDRGSALLVLGYFVITTIFSFQNAQSLATVILTCLANVGWLFVLYNYWTVLAYARHVIIGYLAVWLLFLLINWVSFKPLFSLIKKELRYYYLID